MCIRDRVGTVILPRVTVGDVAIVADGSLVTKDVPENTLVAGVPAQPLKVLVVS